MSRWSAPGFLVLAALAAGCGDPQYDFSGRRTDGGTDIVLPMDGGMDGEAGDGMVDAPGPDIDDVIVIVDTGPDTGSPFAQRCMEQATVYCGAIARCLGTQVNDVYESEQVCRDWYTRDCVRKSSLADTNWLAAADECFAALAGDCDALFGSATGADAPCRDLPGNRGDGMPCHDTAQCGPGFYCTAAGSTPCESGRCRRHAGQRDCGASSRCGERPRPRRSCPATPRRRPDGPS